MLVCTMQLHGQTVREWMGLPPVPVEFPAFGDMKNVENKTFSQADLLTLSTFNIENLTPAVGEQELQYHSLTWETTTVNDNVVISQIKSAIPAIGLYAVYAENTQWTSGKLQFSFYGNAEVYVDGVKKIYCKPRFQGCPGGIYLIPKTREKYTGRVKRSQNRRDTSFSQWKLPDHDTR